MWLSRRRLLSLAAAAAASPVDLRHALSQVEAPSTPQGAQFVFPGLQWEAANPGELGWSI